MPPTPDKIPEKVPFDVYAMLIILTFLFTGGATLMINDRLSKEWQFWDDKATIKEKSVHLTLMNPDQAKYPEGLVHVQETDLKEWKLIEAEGSNSEFPIRDFEWPAGYDPMKYPIKFKEDFLGPKENAEQRAAYQKLADAKGALEKAPDAAAPTTPAPAPAPDAKAPDAKAPDAKAPDAKAPDAKADEKK
jgi:hypothetical protein